MKYQWPPGIRAAIKYPPSYSSRPSGYTCLYTLPDLMQESGLPLETVPEGLLVGGECEEQQA